MDQLYAWKQLELVIVIFLKPLSAWKNRASFYYSEIIFTVTNGTMSYSQEVKAMNVSEFVKNTIIFKNRWLADFSVKYKNELLL